MKRTSCLFILLPAVLLLHPGAALATEGSIYGHVSFVNNEAMVVRADGTEVQAVVNLPIAPGDTVATSSGGRCELQFDNGTVVRLDKDSRLGVATVLTPSLTSDWRITTLELQQGQFYALPQTYAREMFQVVTPNAAVKLRSRVAAYVRLEPDGGASFFSDGGRYKVLYGRDEGSLKTFPVKSGRPCGVSSANALTGDVEPRGIEFMAWNEYVDRHFKELHFGINKVPPKLKFGNSALTYWTEKWSSLYGEWIYDDLFGYVWRPADDRFAYSERPFFYADFVRINGQLFLVPQEAWAWVPAHMGTWAWLKRGWTWIPGDWFHTGVVDFMGTYTYPTLQFYCDWFSAYNWPLYFKPAGNAIPDTYSGKPHLPSQLITIVKKALMDRGDGRRLPVAPIVPGIDGKKLMPAPAPAPNKAVPVPLVKNEGIVNLKRDWNPDSRWAERTGRTIHYSSLGNTVICPELKLSSHDLRGVERMMFRGEAGRAADGTVSSGAPASQPVQDSTGSAEDGAVRARTDTHSGERGRTDDGKGR